MIVFPPREIPKEEYACLLVSPRAELSDVILKCCICPLRGGNSGEDIAFLGKKAAAEGTIKCSKSVYIYIFFSVPVSITAFCIYSPTESKINQDIFPDLPPYYLPFRQLFPPRHVSLQQRNDEIYNCGCSQEAQDDRETLFERIFPASIEVRRDWLWSLRAGLVCSLWIL